LENNKIPPDIKGKTSWGRKNTKKMGMDVTDVLPKLRVI
jgi:hypothetical protein